MKLDQVLLEKKSHFQILKQNEIPLTSQEREEAIKRKAVWDFSHVKTPTSAIWKGKNSKGDIEYVTNTHRAYNTAPTLKGAIRRFHDFIKGTA